MKTIGITGGIGAGKSQVLMYLEETYGGHVCQADEVAKRLQRKGTACFRLIKETFGDGILDREGRIDREKLADLVFADEAELKKLNDIVHPAVKEKIKETVKKEEKKDAKLFVLEAALIVEEHYDAICDEVWYIYADEETRRKRLLSSRGYSREKTENIFKAQLSSQQFFDCCDRAIDNSQSFEETCQQIDSVMKELGIEKQKKETGEE